jgi:hypothetical protein
LKPRNARKLSGLPFQEAGLFGIQHRSPIVGSAAVGTDQGGAISRHGVSRPTARLARGRDTPLLSAELALVRSSGTLTT